MEIVQKLWNDWGYECATPSAYGPGGAAQRQERGQVERHRTQLYTVNVPLVPDALTVEKRKTVWTNMWRSAYGSLFKQTTAYVIFISSYLHIHILKTHLAVVGRSA